ncbi:hypothetical protein PALB_29160 [Pseudoalteromonas luteoviolacea B = ATCC 29581]|nr:hypothetical protein PALB_29160 [Pseudoalteromonas luteoviolacea B = ATCC 29581]
MQKDVLKALSKIAECQHSEEVIKVISYIAEQYGGVERIIVLKRNTPETYQTFWVSDSTFANITWPVCYLFKRVESLGAHFVSRCESEMEFSLLPKALKQHCNNTTVMYFTLQHCDYLVLYTGTTALLKSLYNLEEYILLHRLALSKLNDLVSFDYKTHHFKALFEQTLAQIELFMELSPEWLWRTNHDHEFIPLDEYAKSPKVYSAHFLGSTMWGICSPDDASHLKKWSQFMSLMDKHQEFLNFEFESKNGLWYSLSGKPQFNHEGLFEGYFGIAKDITYNKERELALRDAKLKAENASSAKNQFLGVVSHEIRTPLNAILGIMELLQGTPLSEQQKEWLSHLTTSASLLKGLLGDILDYAKIESGEIDLTLEIIEVVPFIQSIAQQLQLTNNLEFIDFQVRLDENLPKFIEADKTRLSQILFNLLSNAFKFTKTGIVRISAAYQNGFCVFEVFDTGTGIKKDELKTIFEPFKQHHLSKKRKQEGVGLGLAITKQLVKAMQGNITCESHFGDNTLFTVTLPLKVVNEQAKTKEDQSINRFVSLSILVAEDNVPNQLLIRAFLEKAGHRCVIAATGSEALNQIKKHAFDLVLMDVMMPVMDGLEATEMIRKTLKLDLPVWGLTANATQADLDSCITAGMDRVLTKPISYHNLINTIQSAF